MDYSTEPSFKNPAWKEKKLESKMNRQGRGRNKDKDEVDIIRKSDKHERCKPLFTRLSPRRPTKKPAQEALLRHYGFLHDVQRQGVWTLFLQHGSVPVHEGHSEDRQRSVFGHQGNRQVQPLLPALSDHRREDGIVLG
jgi:hypothetical protein